MWAKASKLAEERRGVGAADLQFLSELSDAEYDECLARVDKWIKDHPSLVTKHRLERGRGPTSHANRSPPDSARARAVGAAESCAEGGGPEAYNGAGGGREFKWYTPRAMALESLR